jgi:hypothetical protein
MPNVPVTPKQARWTLLVYLAGERSLADAMILSLKDLYRAFPATGANIAVQFQPMGRAPVRFTLADGGQAALDGRLPRLGEMVKVRCLPNTDLNEVKPSYATRNNRQVLEDFLVSGITANESEHYFVVLSGHASGIIGKRPNDEGFSPSSTRSLDLGPLFASVRRKTGRTIDVLGMDACYMAMCEVCWELRDSVRFLIASEGLTPQAGWPYDRILDTLRVDGGLEPLDFACRFVTRYLRYNSDFTLSARSVDLSASRLEKVTKLAHVVERLGRLLSGTIQYTAVREAVVLAHWKTQSYKSEQYVDLWDFCDLLQEGCDNPAIGVACEEVKNALASPSKEPLINKHVIYA